MAFLLVFRHQVVTSPTRFGTGRCRLTLGLSFSITAVNFWPYITPHLWVNVIYHATDDHPPTMSADDLLKPERHKHKANAERLLHTAAAAVVVEALASASTR